MMDYARYLHLDRLLDAQHPQSDQTDAPIHDELLFIVAHQVSELWFKQILHELESLRRLFGGAWVDDRRIGTAVARLGRVTQIQRLLIEQIPVLESMTPMDFLEFRHLLGTASGLESEQFRRVGEVLCGDASADSLRSGVDRWLARTPFLISREFRFLEAYGDAARAMLAGERENLDRDSNIAPAERARAEASLDARAAALRTLLDREAHDGLVAKGERCLSFEALQGALFVNLYRDAPLLHLPHRLLSLLVDTDELWSAWRQRHALLARRMIGSRPGTGGSSGYAYLRNTVDSERLFADLFDLSAFLIPRSRLPRLPAEVERRLGFQLGAS